MAFFFCWMIGDFLKVIFVDKEKTTFGETFGFRDKMTNLERIRWCFKKNAVKKKDYSYVAFFPVEKGESRSFKLR